MKAEKTIQIKPIVLNTVTVVIEGDSDIILNKINASNRRTLIEKQKGSSTTIKEKNPWEDVITAIHWRDGEPTEFTEKSMKEALKRNAPCITSFGLKKTFEEAITRNKLEKHSTRFRNSVNVNATGGLIPIKFADHYIDEKLISPRRGAAPVLTRHNRFTGWRAEFTIQYVDGCYTLDQIIQIVGLAGFGGGIGSGRSSGYGRFHVVEVRG